MDKRTDRWKKLQYLKAVARVQYEHREWLGQTDQKLLPNGLRQDDVKTHIETARGSLVPPETFKQKAIRKAQVGAKSIFTQDTTQTHVHVDVGGSIKGEKSSFRNSYRIRVGYMWYFKVFRKLYTSKIKEKNYPVKSVILAAEKVRVNDKNFILYEVKLYNRREIISGYVAQYKGEGMFSAFGETAKQAITNANRLVSDAVDESLGIN